MNSKFILNVDYKGLKGQYKETIRYYKGVNQIFFDLSLVHSTENPIVKIDIDFNEGSDIITRIYNYNNHDEIINLISNEFYPNPDYQEVIYFPTMYIKYLDGTDFAWQCPIKITKNSFFGEFSNIEIGSCQFIDDNNNSLFVTLDTGIGDILNIKIK